MNTLLILLIAVVVGYLVLMIFMKLTKWVFRIALLVLVVLVVGFGFTSLDFLDGTLDDINLPWQKEDKIVVPIPGESLPLEDAVISEPAVSEGTIVTEGSIYVNETQEEGTGASSDEGNSTGNDSVTA